MCGTQTRTTFTTYFTGLFQSPAVVFAQDCVAEGQRNGEGHCPTHSHSAPLAPERSIAPLHTDLQVDLSLVASQAAAMERPAVCCRSLASWSSQVRLGRPLGRDQVVGFGSLSRTTGSGGGSARARWPKRRSRAERILWESGG